MSHFTVLVINTKGIDDVEEQLAPFQENNMGNCPKKYLQFQDESEGLKEKFETGSITSFIYNGESLGHNGDRMREIAINLKLIPEKDPNISPYEYTKSLSNYPEYEQWKISIRVTTPYKDQYADWKEYAKSQGYAEHQGKFGYWTNPDSKWDWYQLGGRWAGSLKLLPDVVEDQLASTPDKVNFSWGTSEANRLAILESRGVDQAYKKHIDWNRMNGTEAEIQESIEFFKVAISSNDSDREAFIKKHNTVFWYKPEHYLEEYGTAETFAKSINSFSTYAVLKDGEWIEPGEMGWWGMDSSTKESREKYEMEFQKMLNELPENALLTVVDCHV